jgi:excisionase family DNA binding protein
LPPGLYFDMRIHLKLESQWDGSGVAAARSIARLFLAGISESRVFIGRRRRQITGLEKHAQSGGSMLSNTKRSPQISHAGLGPTPEPDNFSSNRKPPASELPAWNAGSMEPSSLYSTSYPRPDARGNSSKTTDFPVRERLLNAREVAARLGVSERWVRDHTTRRSPKIRGVKLGTLMRYRGADVDEFMERLTTSKSSLQQRFGG